VQTSKKSMLLGDSVLKGPARSTSFSDKAARNLGNACRQIFNPLAILKNRTALSYHKWLQ
jgi:hypothetical protein